MTSEDIDNQTICRYCRGPETPDNQMLSPCDCRGSIAFIHRPCLIDWIKFKNSVYCELCKQMYNIVELRRPGFFFYVAKEWDFVLFFLLVLVVECAILYPHISNIPMLVEKLQVMATSSLFWASFWISAILIIMFMAALPLGFVLFLMAVCFVKDFVAWKQRNKRRNEQIAIVEWLKKLRDEDN